MVVKPKYDELNPFHEGLAYFEIENERGFLDQTGSVAFKLPKNWRASDFSEGLAAFEFGGKWGYLDRNDKKVIPPSFEEAAEFHEGLAAVKSKNKWGYISQQGTWIIAPTFDEFPGPFRSGRALVRLENKVGIVDRKGQYIVKPLFNLGMKQPDGVAIAAVIHSTWNRSQRPEFSEGKTPVSIDGKSWGFINEVGKQVIGYQFEEAHGFSEGLAAVKKMERGDLSMAAGDL